MAQDTLDGPKRNVAVIHQRSPGMPKGMETKRPYIQTKREAKLVEIQKPEEILNPPPERPTETTPTDMDFLDLVNRRLDHVEAYNSESYYLTYQVSARRWIRQWKGLTCSQISRDMVECFILERSSVSVFTANKEIRYLKATFNFGKKKGWLTENPVIGLSFLPMAKRLNYVPSPEDIDDLIAPADPEVQDYLWLLRDTMGSAKLTALFGKTSTSNSGMWCSAPARNEVAT